MIETRRQQVIGSTQHWALARMRTTWMTSGPVFLKFLKLSHLHIRRMCCHANVPRRFPSLSQQLYKCEVLFLKWRKLLLPLWGASLARSFLPKSVLHDWSLLTLQLQCCLLTEGHLDYPQETQVLSLFSNMASDSSADSFSSYLSQTGILNALCIIYLFHHSEFFWAVSCLLLYLRWSATHSFLRTQ